MLDWVFPPPKKTQGPTYGEATVNDCKFLFDIDMFLTVLFMCTNSQSRCTLLFLLVVSFKVT